MKMRALTIPIPDEAIQELTELHDLIVSKRLTVTVEIGPEELESYADVTKAAFLAVLVAAKNAGRVN